MSGGRFGDGLTSAAEMIGADWLLDERTIAVAATRWGGALPRLHAKAV